MLHPASRLLAWMALAALLPWIQTSGLQLLTVLICIALALQRGHGAWRMLRRSWLFLVVLALVFGWATPGTLVWPDWPSISPSVEGLQGGALQAWRLSLIILSLALAVGGLAPAALLAGLYTFLGPMERLGVPVQRLVIRLSLVLEYVQSAPVRGSLAQRLEQAFAPEGAPRTVEIELPAFSVRDLAFGLACCAGLGALLW